MTDSSQLFSAFTDRPDPRASEVARLLDGLNEPQRQAITHAGCPVLVVAGAGSGKTRVLTRRIAYLMAERQVHPGSILAITFTNKAAAEMRERVADLVGRRANAMWVATFHSACVRILRNHIDLLGYRKSFSIYDADDSARLVKNILIARNIDPKRFAPKAVLNWISNNKNELIGPEKAAENAGERLAVFAEIYADYNHRLKQANAVDFDDIIALTVRLWQEYPQVRDAYRRRFRHVLVDEYQDTNHAQYLLIKQLCGDVPAGQDLALPAEPAELMVVGDSDQSIYAFRGATIRNILDFEKDFPGADTILLEQNYRSTQTVLSAANALISHNPNRPKKRLWTDQGDGEKIIGKVAYDQNEEARFIVQEIDQICADKPDYRQIAIFYRTNAQSRAIEEALMRAGLPYRVVGGQRFYERKEIRDILAYLRALANPDDEVSLRRILNVPKRGIGDRAEASVAALAQTLGVSFWQALTRAEESEILTNRSLNPIKQFVSMMEQLRELVAQDQPANLIVSAALEKSGLVAELQKSSDPQDQSRVENLSDFVSIAQEFVQQAGESDLPANGELAMGAAEPDPSLAAFLERIALVADSDQLANEPDGVGQITLMTLHTAKGLEFDTVFLTGMEDGIFPHRMSMDSLAELAEERRLAYVGITRARKRLYLTRAQTRSMWGHPEQFPASRFLDELPPELVQWQESQQNPWLASVLRDDDRPHGRRSASVSGPAFGAGHAPKPKQVSHFAVGDRVLHPKFGMGKVLATSGEGANYKVDVDFGSAGKKRLVVQFAPLEKL